MVLRCKLDGLMLDSFAQPARHTILVFDGDESFELERLEAAYYEVAAANPNELAWLQDADYRCLRFAGDFVLREERLPA
jgi:hypothetical protein